MNRRTSTLSERDYAQAALWANRVLEIDVTDADLHRVFAEALAASHNEVLAAEEYEAAAILEKTEENKTR